MTTYIYSLADPITKQVRYIGKANNLNERFKNHNNKARDLGTYKRNWINSLRNKKLKPVLEIVDIVPIEEWKYWEIYWISQFKTWGFDLINYTEGGDGATFANSTSFKKGQNPWNTGKGNKFICEECKLEFNAPKSSKRRFCSHKCNSLDKSKNLNSGNFKKDDKVWNKGISGYSTSKKGSTLPQEIKDKISNTLKGKESKKKRVVRQYDKAMNFIKEYPSITEAIKQTNFKSISNVLTGRAKTAGGFIWL